MKLGAHIKAAFLSAVRMNSHGTVLLELALILPVLLLLAFSGISLISALDTSQKLSRISREAANTAFRECVGDSLAPTSTCLTTPPFTHLLEYVRENFPNMTLVISAWQIQNAGVVLATPRRRLTLVIWQPKGYKKPYSLAVRTDAAVVIPDNESNDDRDVRLSLDNAIGKTRYTAANVAAISNARPAIFVAEAMQRLPPALIFLNFPNGELYESTFY